MAFHIAGMEIMDSCRRTFRVRNIFVLPIVVMVLLAGCARPPSATVGEGANPFHVDKDVAFRTTYYFRVFDYCVARKLKSQKFKDVVVPLTDSLYRFRMTGKANTLLSNINFESGTLKAWEIDPFGAKVEYDPESRRVRIISPREVAADAKRAAFKRDIKDLLALHLQIRKGAESDGGMSQNAMEDLLKSLEMGLQSKIKELARTSSGPVEDDFQSDASEGMPLSEEDKSMLMKDELRKVLAAAFPDARARDIDAIVDAGYGTPPATLDASDPGRPGFVERAVVATISNAVLSTELVQEAMQLLEPLTMIRPKGVTGPDIGKIDGLIKSLPAQLLSRSESILGAIFTLGQPPDIHCPENAPVRRGFQVLGPEGWRTFDQDERLLLAMSASAQPLISTLKDLSNRVLSARDNPSAELLPIVLEQKRLAEAGRDLDAQRDKPGMAPDQLAKSVCKKLVEDEEQIGMICGENGEDTK